MAYNFLIGTTYNFQVYPTTLGNGWNNCKCVGIMDGETAGKEVDVNALHAQFYPSLPSGTPDSPYDYLWAKFKMPSGQTTILGIPWIQDATVTVVSSQTIVVRIGGVSAQDADKIKQALIANGYNQLSITVGT